MTRIATGLILLAVLAACGADGEPVRPESSESSIEVSGSVVFGVVHGPSNVPRRP